MYGVEAGYKVIVYPGFVFSPIEPSQKLEAMSRSSGRPRIRQSGVNPVVKETERKITIVERTL